MKERIIKAILIITLLCLLFALNSAVIALAILFISHVAKVAISPEFGFIFWGLFGAQVLCLIIGLTIAITGGN